MPFLVDTNVLLRLLQPHHPHYAIAKRAITLLRERDGVLHITAQNVVEFWAVSTRPKSDNGLGLTIEQATEEVRALKHFFLLLPEVSLFEEWERLVTEHRVSGRNAHDARLVAAMLVHKIGNILTFNYQDFSRFDSVTVVDPNSVM